ncbi:TROVE domain-containing protein [Chondromyces crocatus]|uniref:RNA-binding protein n=1 Tax=Chondromyces crocatus TaxID=52 RepID=A0A0K1EKZ5_CHOCO|nr:TROVE domain-containing protein [Chondromyces crocatus]AKT41327.1 RNA-binding protein [Chondromyces crocatus]
MANYLQHFASLFTRQREKALPEQVQNSAGGFVFALDDWSRLDRWLILGADGGTYYASEQALTVDNARAVQACLASDGARTVKRLVEISTSGRAPKNEPALFALAMAAGDAQLETRKAALQALPLVCRTGTDLFHFARAVEGFRRWGRGLRNAVAGWYLDKPAEALAYQAIKYQQRDGWSHRDLLRLSHPVARTPEQAALFRWITQGLDGMAKETAKGGALSPASLPELVRGFEALRASTNRKQVLALIRQHRFTHEMLLTEWKNDPEVWAALLEHMPQTALVRNLGKMTAVGLLVPGSDAARKVAQQLVDKDRLRKARVHPVALLSALKVYEQGHGERAQKRANALSWTPAREIVDALNEAFYLAFQAMEPTGKKHLLALDVSGSMTCGTIAGVPGLTPRVASAAMAMATARLEPAFTAVGFASGQGLSAPFSSKGVEGLRPLGISPKQRLDDVLKAVDGLPFGGTDCALPMIWAQKNKIEVDTFVVYTDNETWAGNVHPFQALRDYRQAMGRPARLIVVGMTATRFTIADPSDPGMLDVVGFDAAAPRVMADFSRADTSAPAGPATN